MKIVTLFFACVALLNFSNVGAMNREITAPNDTTRERTSPRIPVRIFHPSNYPNIHPDVGAMNREITAPNDTTRERTSPRIPVRIFHPSDYPNIHPDIEAWSNHRHTHPARVRNFLPNRSNLLRDQIVIEKVLNRRLVDWFLLHGELVDNIDIADCRGPHGYAIVDTHEYEGYYACLKPFLFHNETKSQEHARDPQVYHAHIIRGNMPRLDADLAPRGERLPLDSQRLLFHGEFERNRHRLRRLGHVRYVLPGGAEVEGDLHKYPFTPRHRIPLATFPFLV